MKRSEMSSNIQILLESIGYIGDSSDGEMVLNLIEKLGMLPPLRWRNHGILDASAINEWEPENEQSKIAKGAQRPCPFCTKACGYEHCAWSEK